MVFIYRHRILLDDYALGCPRPTSSSKLPNSLPVVGKGQRYDPCFAHNYFPQNSAKMCKLGRKLDTMIYTKIKCKLDWSTF